MSLAVDKRSWAFAGLGVPGGVALVRQRPLLQRDLPQTLALVGTAAARGLAPPLARLAAADGRDLRFFPGIDQVALVASLSSYQPGLVLAAAQRQLDDLRRWPYLWLGPLTFPRFAGRVGAAAWYSAWAANIWSSLRGSAPWPCSRL